jgi:hypothetical protein
VRHVGSAHLMATEGSDGRSERVGRCLQTRTDLGQFSGGEVNAFLLYLGSFSLLLSALLLSVSALAKRSELRLHLRDRPRKVSQLSRDSRYVLFGRHFTRKSKPRVPPFLRRAIAGSPCGRLQETRGMWPAGVRGSRWPPQPVAVRKD